MIVFVSPTTQRLVIMRVVGVAGDRLSDQNGKLVVNGHTAPDGYLAAGTVTQNVADIVVPAGMVYVLGDNRADSADSRAYGPVPTGQIKGRLVFRYWPLSRIGGI
jgi:signal peptidase I